LLLRCKDRKTEAAVSMTGFIKCGADVRVAYRIDQEQAVEAPWRSHPSCYLALVPTPIPFIRALKNGGKIFVRMYDNHNAPNDAQRPARPASELCRSAFHARTGPASGPPPPPTPPRQMAPFHPPLSSSQR